LDQGKLIDGGEIAEEDEGEIVIDVAINVDPTPRYV
jgi:hypothetical protein